MSSFLSEGECGIFCLVRTVGLQVKRAPHLFLLRFLQDTLSHSIHHAEVQLLFLLSTLRSTLDHSQLLDRRGQCSECFARNELLHLFGFLWHFLRRLGRDCLSIFRDWNEEIDYTSLLPLSSAFVKLLVVLVPQLLQFITAFLV
jgi:hypothetical protein